METVFNASPESMSTMLDIWFEAFDFPGADRMAKRARKVIPPNLLEEDELSPEQQEAAQAASQAQQETAALTMEAQRADVAEKHAKVGEMTARTELLTQQAAAVPQKLQIDAMKAAADARSKRFQDHLSAIKVAHEGDDSGRDAGRNS